MNFFIRFIGRRNQSARMKALKEQQRLLRSESRSTKFTPPQQPQVFRKSSMVDESSNRHTALKQFLRKDGWAAVGIVLIIIGGLYYMTFRSTYLVLSSVQINQTQFIPQSEVQQAVQDTLNRTTLGIPRNRFITVTENGVKHALEKKFADNFAVANITVTKSYPRTVDIMITERIPSIVWMTKDESRTERFYTIDHDGFVTKETTKREEIDPKLPLIEDKNRPRLGMNWQITRTQYLDSVIELQKKLSEADWTVQSFVFPAMTCEQQEYVAQQIFADEIKDSASEKFKEKKRIVQEKFKKGDLGIEESLQALEDIKKEELEERGSVNGTIAPEKLEWATVDKEVPCDYVQVATDLHVLTKKGSEKTIELKFDTTRSLDEQLNQLQTVVNQGKILVDSVQVIDLRIADRVYYK